VDYKHECPVTFTASDVRLSTSGTGASYVSFSLTHYAAAKIFILSLHDALPISPVVVTVQLQDQFGNVVTSGPDKDKDVTLNTSGSATGGGVVDIVNGVGTKSISDQVAQDRKSVV